MPHVSVARSTFGLRAPSCGLTAAPKGSPEQNLKKAHRRKKSSRWLQRCECSAYARGLRPAEFRATISTRGTAADTKSAILKDDAPGTRRIYRRSAPRASSPHHVNPQTATWRCRALDDAKHVRHRCPNRLWRGRIRWRVGLLPLEGPIQRWLIMSPLRSARK